LRIAYLIYGSGPPLLYVRVFWAGAAAELASSDARHYYDALAARMTLVTFDRRGAGESARDTQDISPQAEARDIEAVANAAGLKAFSIFADGDGLAPAAQYAAEHQERVERLVIWPAGLWKKHDEAWIQMVRENWSYARRVWAGIVYPDGPVAIQRDFGQRTKNAVSSEMAARRFEAVGQLDFAAIVSAVTTPTLVLSRDQPPATRQSAMSLAGLFPAAEVRFVGGAGPAPLPVYEPIVEAIERFVGLDVERASAGVTAIVLFADIVDSTGLTERMGDAAFRAKARDLDVELRRIIAEAGGTTIDAKTLGDGILATFAAASQAIDAALRSGVAGAEGGLPFHIGLHAGDVIREAGNVFGGAVNIAARISALSAPGEVLVSDIVRGLARTSAGVTFKDRGEYTLKGVADAVRLYAVETGL
jgi:class 3 adenylate cyclase/pimeloyl-ACP methyl ester carboxylesterase